MSCAAAIEVPRVQAHDDYFSPDARNERQGPGLRRHRGRCGPPVLGIFTDGDLRRRIEAGADLRQATAPRIMHPAPAHHRPRMRWPSMPPK